MRLGLITTLSIIATLLLATLAVCTTLISEPGTIAYQGTLTNNNGQPLNGPKSIRTCLYNSPITVAGLPGPPDNGSAFWCQTYPNVNLKNGQFSLVLGNYTSTNTLKPKFKNFSSGSVFIGVKVDTDPEIPQRQKLTSVAYAINAVNAVNSVNAVNAQSSVVANTIISTNTESIIPQGTIVAFGGLTPPNGWLLCDGRSLLRTDYPKLYNAILTAHGAADIYHFNLPDYRGRFLRGVDGGTGRDPGGRTPMAVGGYSGNTVGTIQGDSYKNHGHSFSFKHVVGQNGTMDNWSWDIQAEGGYNFTTTNQIGNIDGGTETRPTNASVNWIIKY